MDQQKTSLKVAKDMFTTQFNWTIAFLGILLIVNVVKIILAAFQANEMEGYFNSIFVAGNIYMLIIGIMAIYFLPHFVSNGITRKDYFIGCTLACIGLSISIPIITIVIHFLEKIIFSLIDFQYKAQTINDIELDGNIIGDIVQTMIVSPYMDPNENWFLAIIVLGFNILIAYLLGWFIGTVFYRYDFVIGIISILIAITFKMLKDTFVRISLDLPALSWFSMLDPLPSSIAVIGILLLIVITCYIIRNMTKRVAIKM